MTAEIPRLFRDRRTGRWNWKPGASLRARGFKNVACGPDERKAKALAEQWNAKAARVGGPKLASGKSALSRRGYVYFVRAGSFVKIGYGSNPLLRGHQILQGLPFPLEGFAAVPGTRADERRAHVHFAKHRTAGEWFEAHADVINFMLRCLRFGNAAFDQLAQAGNSS